MVKEVELECGDISASQEDLLSRSSFLGGGGGGGDVEPEVFSTPLSQAQQNQNQQGQVDGEEDTITMCTLPFTQHSPSPSLPSSPEDHGEEQDQAESTPRTKEPRKPRICIRKVRGARIRTPTPSPSPSPDRGRDVDPLYRAVLMIPTAPAPAPAPTFPGDLLALARQRGIF